MASEPHELARDGDRMNAKIARQSSLRNAGIKPHRYLLIDLRLTLAIGQSFSLRAEKASAYFASIALNHPLRPRLPREKPLMGRLALHQDDKNGKNTGHGPMPFYLGDDIAKTCAWLKARAIKVNDIQQVADSPKHTWFWDVAGNALGIEQP